MTSEQPYAHVGYDLMGAAFEVHREIGGGLAEEIYQKCLELGLDSGRSLSFRVMSCWSRIRILWRTWQVGIVGFRPGRADTSNAGAVSDPSGT
ncbi:MAG: GxxExxY protein [Planctomycetaceae bacterium]